ncbi:MAG: hypothetical protein JO247_09205, partial [Chloroflexi bacterium]|nr:hypothetical protein [Chloroflexota bacterium]
KLTKDIETQEFKDTVAYVRSLWDAGVIHPDSPSLNLTTSSANWYAGKSIFYQNGYNAYNLAWDRSTAQDPNFMPRTIVPFGADGGKGEHILGISSDSLIAFKKGSPDRIKEMLGILNFMVAPFGTQENLLLNYGIKGRTFDFDDKGNPVLNKQGATEVTSFPIWKMGAPPPVLFDPNVGQDFAKASSDAESAAISMGVKSPVYGLYSKTAATKNAVLYQKLTDGLNQIIYGRADISTLDGLVKDWKANGGDDIRNEYQQALQESTK